LHEILRQALKHTYLIIYIMHEEMKISAGMPYVSPACHSTEIALEGVLCESFGNETFENITNYGSDLENRGWK